MHSLGDILDLVGIHDLRVRHTASLSKRGWKEPSVICGGLTLHSPCTISLKAHLYSTYLASRLHLH